MKKIILKKIIKAIRKYFPEGVTPITNKEGSIIAYQWTWSREIDDMYGGE